MRWSRLIVALFALLPGCGLVTKTMTSPIRSFKYSFQQHKPNYWERYGKVFYLDGAGALGIGEDTVPKALRSAGFRGDVEYIAWTSHTGPLGDQMIRTNARWRAESLTKKMVEYHHRYPNAPVYVIALSAGTGVGVWAVENLPQDFHVQGMALLSSSLSAHYNMVPCLRHVDEQVFVFFSPHDNVLKTFVPVTGTIDGQYFTEPAGLQGMAPANDIDRGGRDLYKQKLVNIRWRSSFEPLGYSGGHTDAVSYGFVRYYVAKQLKLGRYAESDRMNGG